MSSTLLARRDAGSGLVTLAAWSLMAGAVLQIGLGVLLAPHQNPSSPLFGLVTGLNLTSHLLLLAGIAGWLKSGAWGASRLGRTGLVVTLLGLATLTLAEPASLVNMEAAVVGFGVATLLIMAGMLLAGVAMLRSGHWRGWRRFAPLACGLFVPLILGPAFALPGYAANYAIGAWGLCWLLLGLAVRQTDPATR